MVWCKGESFRNRNLLCSLSIPARENLEFDNFGCPRTWDDSWTRLFLCSIQQNPMASYDYNAEAFRNLGA